MTRARKLKERKVPVRVQRILDACRAEQVLCRQFVTTRLGPADERWLLCPSGRPVALITGRAASQMMQPSGDGLFGPDASQTWRT